MAVNKISMAINYRKNKSTRLSSGGKYYAEVDRQKTLSTRGLAQHLKDHNCMVGRDAIMAVLNEKGGATEAEMMDIILLSCESSLA